MCSRALALLTRLGSHEQRAIVLTKRLQILSITCDNASPNDVMVDELENLIEEFGGSAARTRCFDHVINLVARSMIQQFDARNVSNKEADEELRDLAEGLELEEMVTLAEKNVDNGEDGENDDDGEDDCDVDPIDECVRMTQVEKERLDESFRPVKMMLVKVRARNLQDLY